MCRGHVDFLVNVFSICIQASRWYTPPLFPLFQRFGAIPRLQLSAGAGNLVLTGEEDEYAARRQPCVYFARLADGLSDIVGYCAAAEVDGDRMLAGLHVDDGWWSCEEGSVLREI